MAPPWPCGRATYSQALIAGRIEGIVSTDFSKNTDEDLQKLITEWSLSMFTRTEKGADINSVMLYQPLIQLAQNELTGRFVKKTTRIAIGIGALSLAISFTALVVAAVAALS